MFQEFSSRCQPFPKKERFDIEIFVDKAETKNTSWGNEIFSTTSQIYDVYYIQHSGQTSNLLVNLGPEAEDIDDV